MVVLGVQSIFCQKKGQGLQPVEDDQLIIIIVILNIIYK